MFPAPGEESLYPSDSEPITGGSTIQVDAILFPADEDLPRIISIQVRGALGGVRLVSSMIMTTAADKRLRYPLQLFYGKESFSDDSPVNRSISKITSGKSFYKWAGNVLVLKFTGVRRHGYIAPSPEDIETVASLLLKEL
ncbi:hypothetical protein FRB90_008933 [Tulasnella sp. 427]|nr:hypothetical protein FRB90_008933 [Tulasnella sp. 427]